MGASPQRPKNNNRKHRGILLTPARVAILFLANLALLLVVATPSIRQRLGIVPAAQETLSTQESAIAPPAAEAAPPQAAGTQSPPVDVSGLGGLMVASITRNGYAQLFAYQPQSLPFTQLTGGQWDNIHPAISPDGARVAFASHQGGQWDIFILDLSTGQTTQITDDLDYDGAPAWSSDARWLAYEKYFEGDLEIFVHPLDGSFEPFPITSNESIDFAPAWSPDENKLAFTSNRGGENDIWIADLDLTGDDRFENLTIALRGDQNFPAWSPDGGRIAWSARQDSVNTIYLIDLTEREGPINIGSGDKPIWSPDGSAILTPLSSPLRTHLTAYSVEDQTLALPPVNLGGTFEGASWGVDSVSHLLSSNFNLVTTEAQNDVLASVLTPNAGSIFGRQLTLDLVDVEAPYPQLNALTVEPFYALRDRIASQIGWDVLASLENAFVPFTGPLPPGRGEDWLYTGRAFSLPTVYTNAGFMAVVREQYGGATYWRLYLRARFQDGSQGRPLYDRPWDFNARFSGDTAAYEDGGRLADQVPKGYWVDFTAAAREFGWERLPAHTNWRSYYPGALFNVFVITSGLDWRTAMLQLYPPSIFDQSAPDAQ